MDLQKRKRKGTTLASLVPFRLLIIDVSLECGAEVLFLEGFLALKEPVVREFDNLFEGLCRHCFLIAAALCGVMTTCDWVDVTLGSGNNAITVPVDPLRVVLV